jgi:DNA polymerase III subunit delta'
MIDLIGQEQAVTLLTQAVNSQKIAPAYLFVGIPGIGKSIAARGFAELLLECHFTESSLASHPDVMWVEPTYSDKGELIAVSQAKTQNLTFKSAPTLRIEQIRQISQFLSRRPLKSDRLVVVIEDAHLMSEAPANALLKTLEEPGNGTIILMAPSFDTLLTTIVSRCQCIRFAPLSRQNLELVLESVNYGEILQQPSLIAMAQGSPGSAIANWQQLRSISQQLHQQLLKTPQNYLEALTIAKSIAQELELSTQLWLVDYLQHYYWQQDRNATLAKKWEQTRKYLLSYVQPRLVWECFFTEMLGNERYFWEKRD